MRNARNQARETLGKGVQEEVTASAKVLRQGRDRHRERGRTAACLELGREVKGVRDEVGERREAGPQLDKKDFYSEGQKPQRAPGKLAAGRDVGFRSSAAFRNLG